MRLQCCERYWNDGVTRPDIQPGIFRTSVNPVQNTQENKCLQGRARLLPLRCQPEAVQVLVDGNGEDSWWSAGFLENEKVGVARNCVGNLFVSAKFLINGCA